MVTPFPKRPARFEISYHPSAAPQTLDIELGYAKPSSMGMPEAQMAQVAKHLAMGVCGGAEFSPSSSGSKWLSGPLSSEDPAGDSDHYHWRFDIRGISGRYIRHIVSRMRLAGAPQIASSMIIRGSHRSGPEVTTDDVDAWMADPLAWAGAHPEPGFVLRDTSIAKGFKLRLLPAKPATAHDRDALALLLREWLDAVAFMPNASGGLVKPAQVAKKDLSAKSDVFPITPKPARDQLVSFLIRFHETSCPLHEAELAFPG